VTPPTSHGPKHSLWPSGVRLPALRHRANALLRICSRAGLYEVQVRVLRRYLPRLHGRAKLLAMCEVADALRLGGKFEESRRLSERVLKDSAARLPGCGDVVSTALVECGLVALDRGETDFDKIESLFRRGLEVFEKLVAAEPAGENLAENDIWRARIFNNLGLVLAARGEYRRSMRMYERSMALKARHHERYGIAQTSANLAKLQILNRQLTAASATLSRLVEEMKRIPDPYICGDAIAGCLGALSDRRCLPFRARNLAKAAERADEWWRRLERKSSSSTHSVKRIVRSLVQLGAVCRGFNRVGT
jgi:tetratricopeptide (TPR) repeat protein